MFVLVEILNNLKVLGKDIGLYKYLCSYEWSCKIEVMKMIVVMDGFKFLFDGDDFFKKLVRGIGFLVIDKFSIIKIVFVSYVMGL